jgi:hypothetical protein
MPGRDNAIALGFVELRASRPALAAGAAAVVAAGYVAVADPGRAQRLPTIPCPFHAVTGWWCPGCGMTRAVRDVLTGHVASAFGTNLLWPLVVGVLGWVWAAWMWPGRLPSPARVPTGVWVGLIVVSVSFAVARNTPAFSALAP